MTNTADRRVPHASNSVVALLLVGLSAVALVILVFPSPATEASKLIRRLSESRVDGQRFFHTPASSFIETRYRETLVDAEVFSLSSPSSTDGDKVRAMVAVGGGRLSEAADILRKLGEHDPTSAELLNDLGVVYWGLGEKNPSNYFKALELFQRSAFLAPQAAPPRFNATLGYRRVGLHDLGDAALREYERVEKSESWRGQLSDGSTTTPTMDHLRRFLEAGDLLGATSLLERYSTIFRSMSLEHALNPPETDVIDSSVRFALTYFSTDDETVKAILAPLSTHSQQALDARRLVRRGVNAYYQLRYRESLDLYDLAEIAVRGTGSTFDELWIRLKRADSLLRLTRSELAARRLDLDSAGRILDEVIAKSRELKFNWLLGQALASKGMTSMTTRSQDEILPVLKEAVDVLTAADAPQEAARPLYYLAVIHGMAGDSETSLSMAFRSLRVTPPNDQMRQTELYWLLSLQVHRLGFGNFALPFARQAVSKAEALGNPGALAAAIPSVAMIHSANGDYSAADNYLQEAKEAREKVENLGDRASIDLTLNLACSQIKRGTDRLQEAQECLNRNLEILDLQPKPDPYFFPQTLQQLAQINIDRRDFGLARQQLRRATDVIEENDAYFALAALRMSFENQRRNLYETAIAFEYDHDGKDAAWSYTQRYQSKLFLEFMRQMNPGIGRILRQAIDRNKVQGLIPSDLQIVEYVVLKDRLLVWLISRDKFVSVAVPVPRADLESKIADFIERINDKADIRPSAEDLYRLLIEPIGGDLDPKRALAIIPDQALHRLNFPALYSSHSKTFLIQEYTILESPNLTTLLSGGSGVPSRGPAVSFGARTDNTGAIRELRTLGQFYTGIQNFSGETALKPAFLSSLPSASVFHYAGHSQDASDPLRSSVLLDGDREGPNSVTAVDISRRRMPPNSVVVLASCDSSVGNSRDGIGMRGLTSAFLISGAGSVVGSLWLVEAKSTSDLVLQFHKGFAVDRLPVAVALRNAQLAFIEEGAHPFYWSGFVVTGNTSALK